MRNLGGGKWVAGSLVELTKVETQVEVEVIISMLSSYAIYAYSPGTRRPYSIMVVDADLEDAKALITDDASLSID
jgi:hypothetical protein